VWGFTETCSGSEAGSYLRLIDFVYHSTLGVRVRKKKVWGLGKTRHAGGVLDRLLVLLDRHHHAKLQQLLRYLLPG